MKKWLPFFLVGAWVAQAGDPAGNTDEASHRAAMVASLHRLETLACVTPKPVFVAGPLASLCGPPSPHLRKMASHAPHEERYIKVYVTPEAKQALLDGKPTYPAGTLIVKEKCRDAAGKDTELFTAMMKRESGYNPAAGNWEFMVLDREANITASGKIDSCMECHQKFAQTGFVSRVYLQNVAVTK